MLLTYAFVLVLPWLLAVLGTPLVIRWAHARGWLDHPGERKLHREPVALLGGVAVFAAAAVGVAVAIAFVPALREQFTAPGPLGALLALASGAAAMLVLGTIDDLRDLSAITKLLVQTVIAVGTWAAGFRIGVVELPFGWVIVDAWLPSLVLTVFWILLVTNAFNLIDGMDGLSTGTGVIVILTLFVIATGNRESLPVLASLALAGALAGFLRYNVPPARIFLGDGGAYPIGYTAAVIAIATFHKTTAAMAIAVPLLAMGLPILDTLFAVVRRGLAHLREQGTQGLGPRRVVRAVFRADRGHVHHVLLRAGWSERQALFAIYFVCGLFSACALLTVPLGSSLRWAVAVVLIGGAFALLRFAERHAERRESRDAGQQAASAKV